MSWRCLYLFIFQESFKKEIQLKKNIDLLTFQYKTIQDLSIITILHSTIMRNGKQ